MKHLGDITKIHGCAVPIADCVIGGSPCQDLSVAGKREGLAGARSGLFMEQIRIVKEMRYADQCSGRTGQFIRPRYMVWENVPGAFSSNKGEDFRAVLEEVIRIAEPSAPDIPLPEKGKWPLADCWYGDGWSVAYRVLDAQFWGVPQRRRRIALVADFGGHTAPEILFERDGLCWDSAQGGETGQGTAGDFEDGTYPPVARSLTRRHDGSPRIDRGPNIVCAGFKLGNSEQARSIGFQEERSPTLNAECGGNKPAICYDKTHTNDVIRECGETAPTLQNRMGTGGNQVPLVHKTYCIQGNCIDRADTAGCNGKGWTEDVCYTLNTIDRPAVTTKTYGLDSYNQAASLEVINPLRSASGGDTKPMVATYQKVTGPLMANSHPGSYTGQDAYNDMFVAGVDCRNATETETNGTLQAKPSGGQSLNLNNVVRTGYAVRRLTPLECERLQGFPDGWTDIGAWTDSNGKLHKESSDSARYKALGNSIALPPWKWVLKRLCAFYERDATMASLFDGIGGFPLIWEQLNGKGSCLWASEIEEFPIAVTRRHFSELEAAP